MKRSHLVVGLLLAACGSDTGITYLSNGEGKADAVELAISVGAAAPSASLGVICDGPGGCEGAIEVTVRTPEGCSVLGNCAMIPVGRVDVAIATITQGSRSMELPIGVESTDGISINTSSVVEFTAMSDELVQITITHAAGAPDVTLAILAEWTSLGGGIDSGLESGVFDDGSIRVDGGVTGVDGGVTGDGGGSGEGGVIYDGSVRDDAFSGGDAGSDDAAVIGDSGGDV